MHNASIRTKQLLDFIPVNGNWNVGYMNLVGTIPGKEKKHRKLVPEAKKILTGYFKSTAMKKYKFF